MLNQIPKKMKTLKDNFAIVLFIGTMSLLPLALICDNIKPLSFAVTPMLVGFGVMFIAMFGYLFIVYDKPVKRVK